MTLRADRGFPCDTDGCAERAVFHLNWVQWRKSIRIQHLCDPHAQSMLLTHDFKTPIGVGELARTNGARCFDIELVVISELHDEQVIYLREVGGNRFFPILIGIFEATSIYQRLEGLQVPRPLTHDAIFSTIRALGGQLEDVFLDRFDEGAKTHFAKLRIRQTVGLVCVDVRPSDAFAVSVIAQRPIFVSDCVLNTLFR